jgi:hypothetical protein
MGETVHPQIEHAPVIDGTLADLGGLGAMALQGFVADAAILRRLGQGEAAFWDIGGNAIAFLHLGDIRVGSRRR